MKAMKLFVLAVMATIVAGMPAWAQTRNPGPPPEDDVWSDQDMGGAVKRDEVRKKIEAIRVWRLTEELKLDTNTSAKVASVLSSIDQQRRQLRRDQRERIRELRLLLKSPKPDDAKLKAALDKLEQDHAAVQESRVKELSSLRDILTMEQQARYVLFQIEFMHEMQSMIHGARTGGRFQPGKGKAGADPSGGK